MVAELFFYIMNIALFTDSFFPRINGVVVSVNSFAIKLSELGHNVLIVTSTYTEKQQIDGQYIEKDLDKNQPFSILRLKSKPMFFSPADRSIFLSQWQLTLDTLDAFKPDVLHVNTEWVAGRFAVRYNKLRKTPLVFTLHTYWEKYISNYVKFVMPQLLPFIVKTGEHPYLQNASQLIVPTEQMIQVAQKYGVNCPITILPTGIPDLNQQYDKQTALSIKEKLYSEFPKLQSSRLLIYIGRLAKEKNLPFLLDMLEKVKKTHPDTVLLIVGGGPKEGDLKSLAQKSPVGDSVFFTGFVKSEDVIYYYSLGEVFVFPSKTETQGLVTLEAMRSGIPVVAIGEMGTIDVMQGDHGGFMVKDDIDEFSSKVCLLLDDKKLHDQKAKEAIEWGSNWSLKSLVPKLIDVYTRAIENPKH